MKSQNKRLISAICYVIAVTMVLGVCLLPSFSFDVYAASEGTCGEDLRWTLNGGRLTISGSGNMANYSDGNMAPWSDRASDITNVVIEEGVTSVGELAFVACNSLTNVVLPSTVKNIGIRAFKDCSNLSYINIPSSLYGIYESAFENCVSLNGIRLSEGVVVIADKAFFRCRSLTSITIPRSVNFFGMVVFAYCDSLVRVDMRCKLNKLPDQTFYSCKTLVEVALPEQLTEIGDDIFRNCEKLSSVHYTGDNFETIENQITEQIKSEEGIFADFTGVVNWGIDNKTIGGISESADKKKSEQTTVYESDNTHITTDTYVEYDDNNTPKTANRVVNATVLTEDGVSELIKTIDSLINENNELGISGSIDVKAQLEGVAMSGNVLGKYSGKNVSIELVDERGSSLRLDMKDVKKDSLKDVKLSAVGFDMKDVEKLDGIDSKKIFQITFSKDSNVNSHVGINLGNGVKYSEGTTTPSGNEDSSNQLNSLHYATLYEKNGSELNPVQSVWIDDKGQASFALANIDKKTDYYVSVDTSGIKYEEIKVPKSLASDFELAQNSLPNMEQYKITGVKSRWGISAGRFMIYVGVALLFIIIVVSIIMVSLNKMKNARAIAMGLKPGEKIPKKKELQTAKKEAVEDVAREDNKE